MTPNYLAGIAAQGTHIIPSQRIPYVPIARQTTTASPRTKRFNRNPDPVAEKVATIVAQDPIVTPHPPKDQPKRKTRIRADKETENPVEQKKPLFALKVDSSNLVLLPKTEPVKYEFEGLPPPNSKKLPVSVSEESIETLASRESAQRALRRVSDSLDRCVEELWKTTISKDASFDSSCFSDETDKFEIVLKWLKQKKQNDKNALACLINYGNKMELLTCIYYFLDHYEMMALQIEENEQPTQKRIIRLASTLAIWSKDFFTRFRNDTLMPDTNLAEMLLSIIELLGPNSTLNTLKNLPEETHLRYLDYLKKQCPLNTDNARNLTLKHIGIGLLDIDISAHILENKWKFNDQQQEFIKRLVF